MQVRRVEPAPGTVIKLQGGDDVVAQYDQEGEDCPGCAFCEGEMISDCMAIRWGIACDGSVREDGKDIIFKRHE